MKDNIKMLVSLGKIPNEGDLSNELFKQYDLLLQNEEPLNLEEAKAIISLFSDDCDDLNWGLLHAIESVECYDEIKYNQLIRQCNNLEFRNLLQSRASTFC